MNDRLTCLCLHCDSLSLEKNSVVVEEFLLLEFNKSRTFNEIVALSFNRSLLRAKSKEKMPLLSPWVFCLAAL